MNATKCFFGKPTSWGPFAGQFDFCVIALGANASLEKGKLSDIDEDNPRLAAQWIDYWNGSGWDQIIVKCKSFPDLEVLTPCTKREIKEIVSQIEEKDYIEDVDGIKRFESTGFEIYQNLWQGNPFLFELIEK